MQFLIANPLTRTLTRSSDAHCKISNRRSHFLQLLGKTKLLSPQREREALRGSLGMR
jgi:hypothetical protein